MDGYAFPARLQMLSNTLSDREKEVGEYFLRKPEAAYLSITEVVNDGSLGYGTIIRFCRKMKCAGFQDFKVLLAQELGKSSREKGTESGDRIVRYAEKIGSELANTQRLINRNTVEKVAKALNKAGHVLVAGIAGSAAPAIGFDYRLSRIGVRSEAVCDGYTLAIRAASLTRGDVVLAVSFSGATKDILTVARIAKDNGATVVSLTNFIHAPLVELADLSLFSATDRDPMSCEVFSNVSSDFVLDVVFSSLFGMRQGARRAVERTFNAISDRRV